MGTRLFSDRRNLLDWQLSIVVDHEGTDQAERSGRAKEHQSQEVTFRDPNDRAADDQHENAADVSGRNSRRPATKAKSTAVTSSANGSSRGASGRKGAGPQAQ